MTRFEVNGLFQVVETDPDRPLFQLFVGQFASIDEAWRSIREALGASEVISIQGAK